MNDTLSCLGNAVWFLMGGIVMGLVWWLYGVLCYISIVGIPWGLQCFKYAQLAFMPFGARIVTKHVL